MCEINETTEEKRFFLNFSLMNVIHIRFYYFEIAIKFKRRKISCFLFSILMKWQATSKKSSKLGVMMLPHFFITIGFQRV